MTISKLLLKPHMERLKQSFQEIEKGLDERSQDQAELALRVRKQAAKLDQLLAAMSAAGSAGELVPADWFETFKKFKMELRFAQRKRKLFASNELRFGRNSKRGSHVSTFAA